MRRSNPVTPLDCFAALAMTSLTADSAWGILRPGIFKGWDMASVATRAPKRDLAPDWRDALRDAVRRFAVRTVGALLVGASLAGAVALATHSPTDPSLSTAAGGPPTNWLGATGAYASDLLLLLFGLGRDPVPPGYRHRRHSHGAAAAGRTAGARAAVGRDRRLAARRGARPDQRFGGVGTSRRLGRSGRTGRGPWRRPRRRPHPQPTGRGPDPAGATAAVRAGRARRRLFRARACSRRSAAGSAAFCAARRANSVPSRARPSCARNRRTRSRRPSHARPSPLPSPPGRSRRQAAPPAAEPRPRRSRGSRSATATSCRPSSCCRPPPRETRQQIDRAGLERNARLLETVLEDFNVRGDIVEVRPGPVVTMYELEPASGIKASRVIALADDIARNMSALSARVATIPGRSVIGIELPNPKRETVSLIRADRQPGVRGPEPCAAADPRQEYRRATRSSPTSRRCRICSSPAPPGRASRSASTA